MNKMAESLGNQPIAHQLLAEDHPLQETLQAQTAKGLATYGQPLSPSTLTLPAALQHLKEDAVDAHVYAENLRQMCDMLSISDDVVLNDKLARLARLYAKGCELIAELDAYEIFGEGALND